MKNIWAIVIALILSIGFGIWTVKNLPKKVDAPQLSDHVYQIIYVNDGDTIKLNNNERVRLIGIDTPESRDGDKLSRDVKKRQSDRKTQLTMGKKASIYAKSFLEGQSVRLEYDVEKRDRYGRLLAYVYLKDGTFVNAKIIQEGYAYPLTIPPNVRYAHLFQQWFKEARQQKRGLWQ